MAAPGAAPAGPSEQGTFRDWVAVLGALLGAFMAVLDIQITNASLKDIQGSLAAAVDEGSWISTGYLIAEIVVIPLTGWLGGVFGLRRYLTVNAGLFLVFSVACGMAGSLHQMIAFRVLQGFSGGVLIPTAFTIIMLKLPPSKRPIATALFGMTATFAPAIGPTLGGWLTDTYGWPWIFFINIVPGIALIWAVLYGLDPQPTHIERLKRGDWWGVACMAVGLGCLEYVLEEGQRKDWFGDDLIRTLAVVAVVALVAFVVLQLRRREPLIELRLLARRSLGAACAINLVTGLGLYGSVFILPIYLGQIQGYNAQQIGEVVMWVGVPQLFILPLVPQLMKRFDPRVLIAFGLSLFAASCFINSTMTHDTAGDQLRLANLVRALGQPFMMAPLAALATQGIERAHAASASALFNIWRNLGGSIGIAVLSTFASNREHYHFQIIAERLTNNSVALHARLAAMANHHLAEGGGQALAAARALAQLTQTVRREAFVMAYSDCFFIIGVSLVLGIAGVAFLSRPRPGQGAGAAH